MTEAVLSLGSNLGDRRAHLLAAVNQLDSHVTAISGVYETPPWGDTAQPAYLNVVLIVNDRSATARDWLERAQACERAEGRIRDPERRFGPRTLDVDVIAVRQDDGTPVISDDAELTLPHPRAHLRAFVLRPWLDLRPDAVLPGHGPIAALLDTPETTADLAAMSPRPDLSLESME
ncbi:2-amino-4-hydroxy-6-hydroxymethyldihydropteridine diphosphokinase [Actinoplanes lutulentus]|uniref:2-amino-4-hydroxy-6-hydroxymethyldihydropteridine diphosphokinase n=1 Tax=Actinoplanes lutulentus TaxID=1287878 RepID=A0A327ZCX3_9ACTN|nr:2-amino-4-hydroxy-6-hydroxymethyldihydropteridine diphosphokinase [Actinoplanes lutulentus]MBB2945710.1 2-amino-4-hydroxy-6-hydroxymethyldihydropteridine diphosphokinase [Actinoplanes lutulentus]RAK37759.1 2-amino-4-hydroxy-6-hydroxymethyldihydropteridine diphosphokinase [Actinoplanes lutulentus]